ncbi:MAG: hypothetical protein QNJ13_01865 [Paracoccaceae bacterium]|nr:hypothetical protein [Paracoccaceae bacterium]
MSFIRPEILRAANRWRESLAGGAAAIFGAVLWQTGTGAAAIIGTILVVAGALLLFAGLQRARFRRGGGGAGVVGLDEGRLTYFGPLEGGVIAVADLFAVDLLTGRSGSVWVLEAPGAAPLMIPVNAEGAEVLFDVFGSLPGIDTAAMLRAVEHPSDGRVAIWARKPPRIAAH